jgi:hypothetical protein
VPAVEIYSAWGSSSGSSSSSLALGHRVGVVAGSDGHKGRPGASYPGASQFGAYGGLTGIIADELTPDAIFDAIRARRCYATTGQRIVLRVQANSAPMGSEITRRRPRDDRRVLRGHRGHPERRGPAPWRSGRVLSRRSSYVHDPLADAPLSDDRLRIIWSGQRILGREPRHLLGRAARRDGRDDRLRDPTPSTGRRRG